MGEGGDLRVGRVSEGWGAATSNMRMQTWQASPAAAMQQWQPANLPQPAYHFCPSRPIHCPRLTPAAQTNHAHSDMSSQHCQAAGSSCRSTLPLFPAAPLCPALCRSPNVCCNDSHAAGQAAHRHLSICHQEQLHSRGVHLRGGHALARAGGRGSRGVSVSLAEGG